MKILPVGRLALLIALFSLSLATSPASLAQALTPDQLTKRVEETSRALKDIQTDMKRLNTQMDNRAMLDLLQRVDELADEISQLRGDLELQASDLEGIKKRQRELYLDIDRRMRDLEDRSTGQSSTLAPVVVPGAGSSSTTSAGAATGGSTSTSTGSTPTVPTAAASATVAEEKAAYQLAFNSLKEGRYKKAKQQFSKFLKDYPGSIYAGNAQYWLGEANYVTRNFTQAVKEFNQVLKLYPASSKIPDAMLKLGYTHYELKQYSQAKAVLQELRKLHPNSTAARLAGKRLDRMRKEGA
ncbi:MAG: tol-pal system protein YbgF [Gammaproteobacteria bacterium]|nr:MAG: tol-pal system protein YbgF [Gammaproteobacteria bacterium]